MMQKKKQKLNYKSSYSSDSEVSKIIKILIGVALFLVVFYFLAMLMTGELKFGNQRKNDITESKIQYDEILAGETLNKNNTEYYVLYFDFSENIASTYLTYRDGYLKKDGSFAMYLVDLEKGFNNKYISSEGENREEYPNNIDNLKVTNPTIVKVKDRKVVERIEGRENVKKFLKDINN